VAALAVEPLLMAAVVEVQAGLELELHLQLPPELLTP
jgi:hypothetical protein